MNYRLTAYILGVIALILGVLLCIPFIVALALLEGTALSFGVTVLCCVAFGTPLVLKRPKDTSLPPRAGFVTVALSWILMSLFGCLPYVISGTLTNVIHAFFETVSGFTTTGATVLSGIENLPKSVLLWRALTQWLGGMGVLVFVIAILPSSGVQSLGLYRAEAPGPQAGKLVAKLRVSARILYIIYVGLTILEAGLLMLGKMPVFDSVLHALTTTATGGFSMHELGIAHYNSVYLETVITVFMILSSINFTLFYLIAVGKACEAVRNEELRWYLIFLLCAVGTVAVTLYVERVYDTVGESLRYALFHIVSFSSTTGFVAADLSLWPPLAQSILLLAMLIGGCAGSTAGGLKMSRMLLLVKSGGREMRKALSPRAVVLVRMSGKTVDNALLYGVFRYFILYCAVLIASTLLVSVYNPNLPSGEGLYYAFTASISALNNIGPGMSGIYNGNFSAFSDFSKLVLSMEMLTGRLEILPMLLLFHPRTWRKNP